MNPKSLIEAAIRTIGIRHRTKKTKAGEARPTQVAIRYQGEVKPKILTFESDDDELDWVRGTYPMTYRDATAEDIALLQDRERLPARHIKLRKITAEEAAELPAELVEKEESKKKGTSYRRKQIPASYDGLQPGDVYAMSMGGSGDRLAFALSRAGESKKAHLFRISTKNLKELRSEEASKDNDPVMLVEALQVAPELFYLVDAKDRALIWVRECYRARIDAMKARIGCEQRLRQQLIGQVFCDPNGDFSELAVENAFDKLKANDRVYQNLEDEEAQREKLLVKAVEAMPEWEHVFSQVTGLGPMIAARLLYAIANVRRFVGVASPDEVLKLRAEAREYEELVGLDKFLPELDDRLNECQFRQELMAQVEAHWTAIGRKTYAEHILDASLLYGKAAETRKQAYAAGQEPDPEVIKKLHAEAREHLIDGHYKEGLAALPEKVRNRDNHYQVVQIVRSHCERLGLKTEVEALNLALENYKLITELHRQAHSKSRSRFTAYCGVHVMRGGKYGDRPTEKQFPRRRHGDVANYSPDARQGLYLLGDQWNKRPDSLWGQKLRANKVALRAKHPEPIKVEGKQRYTDGHIHKMAIWRTLTQFAHWLFDQLIKLDGGPGAVELSDEPTSPAPKLLPVVTTQVPAGA